jgi:DNA mismatch repair protein MutL
MLLPDHTPAYFLYFDIHPDAIDVNILPNKTEIKFADEQAIFQILLAAIKESLGKFNVAPSLDFTSESQLDFPHRSVSTSNIAVPRIQIDPTYNPFKSQPTRQSQSGWEQLYQQPKSDPTETIEPLFEDPNITEHTTLLQIDSRYILALTANGLMLIHQHRAHTCVLYKVLLEQLANQQAATQPLLFPEIVELTPDDLSTLETLLPELTSVGFGLVQFSPAANSITAIPALLGQKNAAETILQVIHKVQDTEHSAKDQWQEMIALSLAEQMAIPQGKALTNIEMHDLVERLQQTSSRYLPNGKKISTILSYEEIQKRF